MQYFKVLVMCFFCELMSFPIYAQDDFLNIDQDDRHWRKHLVDSTYVGGAKPTVQVHFKFNDIRFISSKKVFCNTQNAAGCAHYRLAYEIDHDCSKNKVDITLMDLKNYPFIEILDKASNTIFYDQILKHEMTHIQIYRGNVKKMAPQIASNIIAKYDQLLKQGSNNCFGIKNNIQELFAKMFYEMLEEIEKKQKLIDGDENYSYQNQQVLQKIREKEHSRYSKESK